MLVYPTSKAVHVTCVAVSFVLFFLRGPWMIGGSTMLQRRWVRVLPHVNDTVLLAAAIALALMLRQYPSAHGWLTAKVLALAAYILLGSVALGPSRPQRIRIAAWVAAQALFLYIVAVALTRDPLAGLS